MKWCGVAQCDTELLLQPQSWLFSDKLQQLDRDDHFIE